jgi:hypothetical protein
MVSSKKKWTVMNPIRRRMKKRNPSSGQNGQLVHWWLLIHSGRCSVQQNCNVPFVGFDPRITVIKQECLVFTFQTSDQCHNEKSNLGI